MAALTRGFFLQYPNDSPTESEPPPPKSKRKTNARMDPKLSSKSVDELYVELPPPPREEDPDPTAPPNSNPGRVIYPRFQCTMCEAKFPRKNAVVAHIKTHVGKRRFTCSHDGW